MRRRRRLDQRLRLLVLEVPAGDQAVDGVAEDDPGAVRPAGDVEGLRRGGAEDGELGDLVLPRALGRRPRPPARATSSSPRSSPRPRPGRADEVTITGKATRARHSAAAAAATSGVTRSALRQRQQPRQRGEPRVVLGQLALDHLEVALRVRAVQRREIQDVHQQPRALDVREEVVAEPGALGGALDQPRDVGEHELAVVGVDRPQHRLQRRERVRGDLRLRARHHATAARTCPRSGSPTSPTSASSFRCSSTGPFLARQAALGEPRRLARGGGERLVAAPARAAAGDRDLLAGPHEVVAAAVPALDVGARRHGDHEPVAVGAGHQLAQAVPAALGLEAPAPAEGLQVAQGVVAAQDDVAAAAAVAAVGPALGHARLAPERHRAVAAPSGLHFDPCAIRQHAG